MLSYCFYNHQDGTIFAYHYRVSLHVADQLRTISFVYRFLHRGHHRPPCIRKISHQRISNNAMK